MWPAEDPSQQQRQIQAQSEWDGRWNFKQTASRQEQGKSTFVSGQNR